MSRVKCYNCKKEEHFAKDCKKAKVKDYEYYKTKMLLAKKDKDEQVLLAEDQAWMKSSSDSDQEINANMVFMGQIEKFLSDSEASSSFADEKISEIQVAQKKVKIAFENADSSLRVELLPSKIKYDIKVVLSFHNEFLVFSSLSRKGNDGLLQDQVFKNKEEVIINVT
uniref:CCHC-type domain-containing protein n=1 Tax=Tanacetum cinerariifolium TaxID=118510 RepID=A0A6L2N0B0_TANCI|nr:hypothetical protein [Tanacetum cinerariifolium]